MESPSNPHETYTDHLTPYGTPLHPIDSTRILRLCMQNTQFSFQLFNDGLDISHPSSSPPSSCVHVCSNQSKCDLEQSLKLDPN